MASILIIEDEPAMQIGLRDNLEAEGYDVEVAADGNRGLQQLTRTTFDLAILDVMLPRMSGFDVLREARARGVRTPVIMLTAKGEEVDRVLGLELGADDYITKPFSLRELLARVRAVLRRTERSGGSGSDLMVLGDLTVNFATYQAMRAGAELTMTPREFDVLRFLWDHRTQTVTRDQLLEKVWGYERDITTRTFDNFILRLRQKLEADPAHPRHLLTVHGAGYKLLP